MTRALYLTAGFVLVGLAGLGFVLPVLPGTPFLLLAAWCFARSSERWHQWLLGSELFGPVIQNWEDNRCISLRTKFVSLTSMSLVGGTSVIFAMTDPWFRGATIMLLMIGAASVLSIKTCEPKASENCGCRQPPDSSAD